ncbi:MAG: hypothetical protein JXA61_03950, partial [Bacteroidales bacterium]|nr:hypothetical protein [Bacteroidales bacterium]
MNRINIMITGIKKTVSAFDRLKKFPLPVFVMVLILVSLLYYYPVIAFSPPQSIHRWRQTDCTSITLNYYQHGMKFFKPEVHSLVSDGYTTGYAAGEAPVLYYFMAVIYKISGPDDAVYRIINTLIFYIGLCALFKTGNFFLHDNYNAAFIPLLIFTSPVAAYYGCNYLPDTAAMTLAFLGWWQFLKYYAKPLLYWNYILALLFFTAAGLLKISMSISLAALTGIMILRHLKIIGLHEKFALHNAFKTYLPIITGICIIAAWYLYAIWYNNIHQSTTFLTGTRPWWGAAPEERKQITQFILQNNLTIYFSGMVLFFLAACLILAASFIKKLPKLLVVMTGLLLAGGFGYVNLWYLQFQYHDYYF